jgi:hypothetical protein
MAVETRTTQQTFRLTRAQQDEFYEQGYTLVRGLLPPEDIAALRQRADDIAYRRIAIPENESVGGRGTGIARGKPGPNPEADEGAIPLTPRHARQGHRVYHLPRQAVDEAALAAQLTTGSPWNEIGTINHLTNHDSVFRRYAAHPNIVAVLRTVLSPDCKLFFDHLYNKLPYGRPNRYHQDGFFMFTDRSVTVWIALDEVTPDNGCFYYLPESLGYGRFRFDALGDGITPEHLAGEVAVTLRPGDAAIHDRWTIHATGPNETPYPRRGWALHYTKAKSRFVDDPTDPDPDNLPYHQDSDGVHWTRKYIYGNREYILVCGREFPGCV